MKTGVVLGTSTNEITGTSIAAGRKPALVAVALSGLRLLAIALVGVACLAAASPGVADAASCSSSTPPLSSSYGSPASCSAIATITVDSGNYAIVDADAGSVPSFGTITLNGYDQYAKQADAITAVDASGSGAGWNMTVAATGFEDTSGSPSNCTSSAPCVLSGATVEYNASSASPPGDVPPSPSCATGSTCADDSGSSSFCTTGASIAYPVVSTSSAATFCAVSAGEGMGAVALPNYWWLKIPGNATLGGATSGSTFVDTLTVTLSAGP